MRIALKWGTILGLSVILWTAAVHLLGIYTVRIEYAKFVDIAAIVIPMAALTLALTEQRRALDDTLPFGRGVLTGVAVAAVAAPITVAALWYYHHQVNPQWLSFLVAYEQQTLSATGLTADQVASRIAALQRSAGDQQQIIGGLIGMLATGLALSLVITPALGLLRRMQRRSLRQAVPKPPR